MNDQVNTQNAEQAAETVKLTPKQKLQAKAEMLRTRIEADTAKYTEIVRELEQFESLASLAIGTPVRIKLGRKFADKDTTRIVEGSIAGIKDEAGTLLYKVQYGSGFDADFAVVTASSLILA